MFDKRLLCTGAAIVAVGMIAVVASSLPAKIENVQLENLSDVEISSSTSEQLDYEYILREYSGRIAVFAVNSENPDMVLDVMVKYLPDYDKEQLKNGIKAKTYEELIALIEDFTS